MNQSELTAAVAALKLGESLLTTVRKVNGGKVQIELAEVVKQPSLLSMLNKSDDKFSGGAPRRGWMSVEPNDLTSLIPAIAEQVQACVAGEVGNIQVLGIKNPSVGGQQLGLRIIEATESKKVGNFPGDYELENTDTMAKRAGNEGNIIMHGGEPVYSKAVIESRSVIANSGHVFLQADAVGSTSSVSESAYAAAEAEVA